MCLVVSDDKKKKIKMLMLLKILTVYTGNSSILSHRLDPIRHKERLEVCVSTDRNDILDVCYVSCWRTFNVTLLWFTENLA